MSTQQKLLIFWILGLSFSAFLYIFTTCVPILKQCSIIQHVFDFYINDIILTYSSTCFFHSKVCEIHLCEYFVKLCLLACSSPLTYYNVLIPFSTDDIKFVSSFLLLQTIVCERSCVCLLVYVCARVFLGLHKA